VPFLALAVLATLPVLYFEPPALPQEADLEGIERQLKADAYAGALDDAERLVGRFPASPVARALHALALLRAGRIDEAGKEFQVSLDLDPGCPEAHLGKGILARWGNRPEEAERHLLEATSSERLAGEAYFNLKLLYSDLGEIAAAREAAQRALEEIDYLPAAHMRELSLGVDYLRSLGSGPYIVIPDSFVSTTVPILENEERPDRPIPEIGVRINDLGPWPFDLDSAYRGYMTVSTQLASTLGLRPVGDFQAAGVGSAKMSMQGSYVDRIAIGDLVVGNVPVMILDSPTFRGRERGLIGTGLLKRFNCTMDTEERVFEIFRGDRPDLLEARIDPSRVVARAPLFIVTGPLLYASMGGGDPEPFLLDTAASATLVDDDYFDEHIAPGIPPDQVLDIQVRGVGGAEAARMVRSGKVELAGALFDGVRLIVLDMERINSVSRKHSAGILGTDILRRYRIHLNFSAPELILESRGS
jgi:hypothetical protein